MVAEARCLWERRQARPGVAPWGWYQSQLEAKLGWAMWVHEALQRKFVSQYQIGPHRVDFAFPLAKIVVEADGVAYHSGIAARWRDFKRDRYMKGRGWRVIRFEQDQIERGAAACAESIARALARPRTAALSSVFTFF